MTKKTILIVDDEQNIRLLVSRILSSEYDVIEAKDGREAISIAQTQKPDLILLDILMPGVDGYSTCATLKLDEQTRSIPVLMLTGLSFDLNKQLAQETGAEDYITKPFKEEELLKAISSCLSKYQY